MSNPISILFMDDEPTQPVVINAQERLRKEGFSVDFVDTMSSAIQAYYEKFYDIFVLDIDMSHLPDSQEGDGVKVLKRFVSLHNQTKVILFSGAGTVPHWFASANAHCFGYIAKDQRDGELDSIGLLIASIREAEACRFGEYQRKNIQDIPHSALLISNDDALADQIADSLGKSLDQGWRIERTAPDDVLETPPNYQAYGLVILAQHAFSTRSRDKRLIDSALSGGPAPNVIVACDGLDESRPSILYVANRHPFRMVDLLHPQWPEQIAEAAQSALTWYGRQEIFPADSEALRRIHITLPEDIQATWDGELSEDELEELYADYEIANNSNNGEASA